MENQEQNNFEQEDIKSAETTPTAPEKKPVPKINIIISTISIIVIIASLIVIFNVLGNSKISMDEYNQIKNGMSYSEVVEIIGGEGELSSSYGSSKIYTWEGNGTLGANAVITFQNGKVVGKAQAGLQ